MAKSILIVDDNPNMSSLLVDMLEIFDYESVRAGSGAEALEKLEQDKFSMVITDIRMPNMTGLELMEKVKGVTGFPTILKPSIGEIQMANPNRHHHHRPAPAIEAPSNPGNIELKRSGSNQPIPNRNTSGH